MEDYSGLKAGIPAAPVTGRVWSVPKKRRAEERNPSDGEPGRDGFKQEERAAGGEERAQEERDDPEVTCYGSHGFRWKKRRVDVII